MRSDEQDGCEAAAALLPAEVCTGLTLFQIEEGIALLAESAEEEGLKSNGRWPHILKVPWRSVTA